MRKILAGLIAFFMIFAIGCNKKTDSADSKKAKQAEEFVTAFFNQVEVIDDFFKDPESLNKVLEDNSNLSDSESISKYINELRKYVSDETIKKFAADRELFPDAYKVVKSTKISNFEYAVPQNSDKDALDTTFTVTFLNENGEEIDKVDYRLRMVYKDGKSVDAFADLFPSKGVHDYYEANK
ncbi:MAG: hypothetical protein MSH08_07280 [Ezakiella sp.]|nr:hypothetical protein [Ezakiella sp.]MDD7472146.1 hypothetical protein [Bacillota bacterium]MDY3923487.1 hypothetical protein [Ezakiella sp.]